VLVPGDLLGTVFHHVISDRGKFRAFKNTGELLDEPDLVVVGRRARTSTTRTRSSF
jgi:hypothetical protein